MILSFYLQYGLVLRRSHDLPKNSIFAKYLAKDDEILAKAYIVLLLLPNMVGLVGNIIFEPTELIGILGIPWCILHLYLLFVKGESSSNDFGPDPLGYAVNKNDPRTYRPQNSQKKTF